MSKRTSIGSWAFTIGPYANNPIDFDTVCDRLKELGFDGVELGAFPPHPNPGNPNGPDEGWPGAMPDRIAAGRAAGEDDAEGPRVQRDRRQPLGREADQHGRPVEVHRRVPAQLRVRTRSRHSGDSRRLRPASDDSSRDRLQDRHGSRRAHMEDLLRHCGRERAVRHVGVRARLRLQQAERRGSHSRCGRQAELRPAVRHLPRPDGGRDRRSARKARRRSSPTRSSSSGC